jgi:hypothetical protein
MFERGADEPDRDWGVPELAARAAASTAVTKDTD